MMQPLLRLLLVAQQGKAGGHQHRGNRANRVAVEREQVDSGVADDVIGNLSRTGQQGATNDGALGRSHVVVEPVVAPCKCQGDAKCPLIRV